MIGYTTITDQLMAPRGRDTRIQADKDTFNKGDDNIESKYILLNYTI